MYSCTLRPVNDATEGSAQEAHMGASCLLPRKESKIVWVCVQFSFEENNGCFLLVSNVFNFFAESTEPLADSPNEPPAQPPLG